jgi:murein DD-endopeptidase MepM/ murein hydrolase activator NlpD
MALLGLAAYRYFGRYRQPARPIQIQSRPIKSASPDIRPELIQVAGSFQAGQTVTQALLQQGLSNTLVAGIIDCARPVYNLARIRAGRPYWLRFTPEGEFRDFRYDVDGDRYLTVYRDVAHDLLVPVLKDFRFETRVEQISGVIESSLFAAVTSIGEKDQLALDLADIFGSDIDFLTDIQRGDFFRVLVEKKYINGQFAKYGSILAAVFHNLKKQLMGFQFEDIHGKPAYYDPDGKALKKSFLKSPLKFARITSKFSSARMHPILKTVRPHLGVDYAAPIGTKVQAVGSGVVVSAGMNGGSGRMIRIRHAGGYETMYLHLLRINVQRGARVSQGDVIGLVGSSGLSTGPHLDFRIQRHGKALNPVKVIFPPGAPVPPEKFARFAVLRDSYVNQLK